MTYAQLKAKVATLVAQEAKASAELNYLQSSEATELETLRHSGLDDSEASFVQLQKDTAALSQKIEARLAELGA